MRTAIRLMVFQPGSIFAANATKLMTNADVIALVEAGLSEGIIIEKIRSSKTQFDTSTDGLLKLKKAGISDAVIRLMVNPDAKTENVTSPAVALQSGSGAIPAPCQIPTSGPVPWLTGHSPAMWYVDDTNGQRVEMMYERGTNQEVGFMGIGATLLVLHPINAELRLGHRPTFYSCINPTDAPLIKFELDRGADERNTSVSRGAWGMNRSFRLSEKDLVPFSFKKTPQGFFEIQPKSDLPPGEYGFVPQASPGYFMAGERVYTFGVD